MKTFILIFVEQTVDDVRALKRFLDRQPQVLNWMVAANGNGFIVSNHTARYLAQIISKQYSGFLLAEYNSRKADGMLTFESWKFINSPTQFKGTLKDDDDDDLDDDEDDDDLDDDD